MKPKVNITQIVEKTRQITRESVISDRLGKLVRLDVENNRIWVDYDDNPFDKPVLALLGNANLTFENFKEQENVISWLQLRFINGDLTQPVIRDVLYSASCLNRKKDTSPEHQKLHVKADEIILEGKTRITLKCGQTQTTYTADRNEIVEVADQIDSTARINNKLRGGKVSLN